MNYSSHWVKSFSAVFMALELCYKSLVKDVVNIMHRLFTFDKQCHKTQTMSFPIHRWNLFDMQKCLQLRCRWQKPWMQHANITSKDIRLYFPSSWNNLQIQFFSSNNFSISPVFHLLLIVPKREWMKKHNLLERMHTKERGKCYSTRKLLKCIIRASINSGKIFY